MTELLQKAFAEISKLPEKQQDEVATWILEKFVSSDEDEAEWEEKILLQALDGMLKSDGSIDFDKLRNSGTTMTLDEFYIESDEDG